MSQTEIVPMQVNVNQPTTTTTTATTAPVTTPAPAPAPTPPPPPPQGVQVKIHVAIPTTQYVTVNWTAAFQQMMNIMPAGSSYTPISQYGVAEARERLVDIFMAMPDMTHILFWDTDILPPQTVDSGKPVWLSMLESGSQIVAGCYVNSLRTGINGWTSTGAGPDGVETHQVVNTALRPQLTNLIPVDLLGFGFVLIAKTVFQSLKDKGVKRPWFRYLINDEDVPGKPVMMSEDFYFCKKIVFPALGIKPVIDQRIQCVHLRMTGFRPDGSIV